MRAAVELSQSIGRPVMKKSELIQILATKNPHLFKKDIERLVDTVFDEIVEALSDGRRVELRGFGSFCVKHRRAREGRNPQTGRSVDVAEKWVPFFTVGKELRTSLNCHP